MAKKTWKPGESGNPNGRPAGTTLLGKLRTKHQGDIEDIFDALITLAKDGDTAAAQIIMSRMLPPVRPVSEPVMLDLPDGSYPAKAEAVVQAVSEGRVSPPDAKLLLDAIQTVAQLSTLSQLEERLAALEERR